MKHYFILPILISYRLFNKHTNIHCIYFTPNCKDWFQQRKKGMLYFLKQTFNMHESHIHSFLTHFPFICYNNTNFWPVPMSHANGFIALPPLTLTSFKAMDVTLKYARFLKIRIVALYQERTILIISKFLYIQCIGRKPVKHKPISRGISSEWYTTSFPIILLSEII